MKLVRCVGLMVFFGVGVVMGLSEVIVAQQPKPPQPDRVAAPGVPSRPGQPPGAPPTSPAAARSSARARPPAWRWSRGSRSPAGTGCAPARAGRLPPRLAPQGSTPRRRRAPAKSRRPSFAATASVPAADHFWRGGGGCPVGTRSLSRLLPRQSPLAGPRDPLPRG